MQSPPRTRALNLPWPIIALGGWVLPGLGHVLAGHTRRGLIVGATLLALFVAGMLLGGIDAVDRRRDTLWFAGQSLIGPVAFAADYAHRILDRQREQQVRQYGKMLNTRMSQDTALRIMIQANAPIAYRTSVGKPNEYGTLYCTLAGIMNLLVILDAIGKTPSPSATVSRDATRSAT